VTGISVTQLTVSAPDAAKLLAGAIIRVHNATFSIDNLDVVVASVVGVTVTTETTMGFTPAVGQKVNLVGYLDGGGAYRWI
jgi:hypothetical protein